MQRFIAFLVVTWLPVLLSIQPAFSQSAATDEDPDRYLIAAKQVANWLESVKQHDEQGRIFWPTAPGVAPRFSFDLYHGNAGVVTFYTALSNQTRNPIHRQRMIDGANHLCHRIQQLKPDAEPGLYTGAAGYGLTMLRVWQATDDPKYRSAAEQCLNHLVQNKKSKASYQGTSACHFNSVTDIISGSAGICNFLLAAADQLDSDVALDLATSVADGLVLDAIESRSDDGKRMLRWRITDNLEREYPNFSHGTAGVCWALMMVDEQLKLGATRERGHGADSSHETASTNSDYDGRFLQAALAGGEYLKSIALVDHDQCLILHHTPGGEDLFYLGWCHGPAGTAKVFQRLAKTTGDRQYQRLSELQNAALLRAQLFRNRTPGFWNNVGLCCGSAGVALHLKRVHDQSAQSVLVAECRKLSDDILDRAHKSRLPDGKTALSWKSAEHRVKPDQLTTQTGLMQGAAGVGLWLLEMHQLEKNTGKK